MALVRRRGDADDAQHKLSRRREEAEPGRGGSAGRPDEAIDAGTAELRRLEAEQAAPILSAATVGRVAVEAGRMAGRPSLDMSFGRDLHVRITRSTRGIELLLSARPALRGATVAELPALVAALRARGVPVARAEVRANGARTPGPMRRAR